jgi:hypothetical protein
MYGLGHRIGTGGIKPKTLRGAHSKVRSPHHSANPNGLIPFIIIFKFFLYFNMNIENLGNYFFLRTPESWFHFILVEILCVEPTSDDRYWLFMQGPNKKILCQLSMLKRSMSQSKAFRFNLYFF